MTAALLAPMVLLLAVLVDEYLGEWPAKFHPVVWIGSIIRFAVKLAPQEGRFKPFVFGLGISIVVPALAYSVTAGSINALARIGTGWFCALSILLSVYWVKSAFALKSLCDAAKRVEIAIRDRDIAKARDGLSWLCSRDPANLDESEICAAAMESVAENASDSLVAPLFFLVLFGPGASSAYRAINTMDAMIGYRGRYEYLGKAAARLDDIANWIPARLTALLFYLCSRHLDRTSTLTWAALRREAKKTDSPNAGWPMACVALALDTRLEKREHYCLHPQGSAATPERLRHAISLTRRIGRLSFAISAVLLYVSAWILRTVT